MLEEPEDNRLDQSLRDTFSEFDLPPARHVWTDIERRLADLPPPVLPVRRRRPLPVPLLMVMVALLAGLGGWLLPRTGTPGREQRPVTASSGPRAAKPATGPATTRTASSNATHLPGFINQPAAGGTSGYRKPAISGRARSGRAAQPSAQVRPLAGRRAARKLVARAVEHLPALPAVAIAAIDQPTTGSVALPLPAAPATGHEAGMEVPARLRTLVALEQSIQAAPSVVVSAEAARAQQVARLRAERAELLRLQVHTDSMLVVLGEVPVVVPPALAAAGPAAEVADTARPRPLRRRWSLQLAAAPEQNALTQGGSGDSLTHMRRGYEAGRPGVNAHLLAEYRLSQRLSIGAGLGYSAFGTELRINNRRTEVDIDYHTTTTSTFTAATSAHQTYSIRITQVPMLNPIFNPSGQVLGYDTVYTTRQDTLFTTTVLHDTVRTTVNTTTPIVTRREVSTNTILRPNYRFATVPVLLRYRITPPGNSRWWTDVALGAQFQVFLGGTQAVTSDGVNFRTEAISAGAGPFRALNVALSGSLAMNYALSDRLSVSVAPSLRWQALSLYKPETGLKQQPTATGLLMGIRWQL